MRKSLTRIVAGLLAMVLFCPCGTGTAVKADSIDVKPYIAFGADLNSSQKAKVMELMGVTESELADYETIEVTNEDEHDYLDSYLDKSVIGTRALSSVKIEEADAEAGITVEAHNISFCTEEMYTNALVTAGISDANVTVAAPFSISGTAALVGAMKAYGTMTGEEIDSDSADAATNELVLTGELGDSIGKDEAAELVALVKNKVLTDGLDSEEEIMNAIDEASEELNLNLTDEQKNKLSDLMKKIEGLDLDIDKIKSQAQSIYDKLKNMDIDLDGAQGFLDKVKGFFSSLWDKIKGWFGA